MKHYLLFGIWIVGDLLRFNGQYSEAIKEYQNSLNLKKTISTNEESDREVAFLHFSIATAHIYYASEIISSEKEGSVNNNTGAPASVNAGNLSACINEKKSALSHYESAYRILSNIHSLEKNKVISVPTANSVIESKENNNASIKTENTVASDSVIESKVDDVAIKADVASSSSQSSAPLDDLKEMCDELVETIDALKVEIASQVNELNSRKRIQAVTTTIGFGGVGFGNSGTINAFGNSFSSSNISTSASAGLTSEGMMQVRKKVKPN